MKFLSHFLNILIFFILCFLMSFTYQYTFIFKDGIYILIFLISLIFIGIISVLLHELGHFLFGKLTGYKLILFRLFNKVYIKETKKKNKSFQPGILGQCLMYYDNYENKQPYLLYNYGGVIINYLLLIIFSIIYIYINNDIVRIISFSGSFVNFVLAYSNIALFKNQPNDGRNIKEISESNDNKRLYFKQLKNSKSLFVSDSFNDLDLEYDLDLFDSYLSFQNFLLIYYKLFDEEKYEEAFNLMEYLYLNKENMILLYQYLIIFEYVFISFYLNKDINYNELIKELPLKIINVVKNNPNLIYKKFYITNLLINNNNNNYILDEQIIKLKQLNEKEIELPMKKVYNKIIKYFEEYVRKSDSSTKEN